MVRGQRDYGMYAATAYGAGVSDMAELAARLGSIVTLDRRGRVILLDDCEESILKFYDGSGGTYTVTLDSTTPKSGSQCIKLTAGALATDFANIGKRMPPLTSHRLGLEVSFSKPSANAYLALEIIRHNGADSQYGNIRIDVANKKIAYMSAWLVWTDILDIDAVRVEEFCYYPVKLVVDFDTKKFVRLIYAGVEYDLSAYPLHTWVSYTTTLFEYAIALGSQTVGAQSIYVDDFILTMDEP